MQRHQEIRDGPVRHIWLIQEGIERMGWTVRWEPCEGPLKRSLYA